MALKPTTSTKWMNFTMSEYFIVNSLWSIHDSDDNKQKLISGMGTLSTHPLFFWVEKSRWEKTTSIILSLRWNSDHVEKEWQNKVY